MRIQKSARFLKAAIFTTAVLLCLAQLTSCLDRAAVETAPPTSSTLTDPLPYDWQVAFPSVSAASAVVIEAETGKVILEKNADTVMPMASTTKIMTALVAIENADVSKKVSVSKEAVGIEGSSIYLYEDEELLLEDLLYAMLLESANDAAAAIAIEVGGSIEQFAKMMNQKAGDLKLTHTSFANPHGLDDPDHHTTAKELAVIAAEAMKNETFRSIVSTYKKTIPLNETEGVRLLINHNKLLNRYDGAIGVKTGYTKKSGRCLVSAAERDHVKLICVTLNAPDDWNDHATMLDKAFAVSESRLLCDVGEFSETVPVIGGDTDYVTVINSAPLRLTVPKALPEVEITVELPRFLYAPVVANETVGFLLFKAGDVILAKIPIQATYGVETAAYKRSLAEKLSSLFEK